MRRERRNRVASGLVLAAILTVAAVMATGCGGSGKAASASSSSTAAAPNSTPAGQSATTPASTTPAGAGLSGKWSGQYGGAFQGSFTLNWKQSGSKLSGTIKLSNPPSTSDIQGAVNGGSISFGTVGSFAVTYSGSVSGSSMSGSYKSPKGGGSWSAHKAS
jgi:hypothetical protein